MFQDSLTRRTMLLWATAAAALAGRVYGALTPRNSWPGAVLQADDGDLFIAGRRRAPVRIKVDSTKAPGTTMSMVMSEVAPGAGIPVHLHQNEDELILIHQGRGTVTLGDQAIPVTAGAILYAPRGIWHGVDNTGTDTLIWCAVYSPPGFEQYFRETGVPMGSTATPPSQDQIAAIAKRYGMVFRSP